MNKHGINRYVHQTEDGPMYGELLKIEHFSSSFSIQISSYCISLTSKAFREDYLAITPRYLF